MAKGIRNVANTSKRADAAKELAKKVGAKVRDLFWTIGRYDVALILEAPDDETMVTFGLSAGKLGNVRSETLRPFSQAEINQILKRVVYLSATALYDQEKGASRGTHSRRHRRVVLCAVARRVLSQRTEAG
jgi:uncharacterized protein with GYD domain